MSRQSGGGGCPKSYTHYQNKRNSPEKSTNILNKEKWHWDIQEAYKNVVLY